jgi:DNA-binding MarR family transcriptional regulator
MRRAVSGCPTACRPAATGGTASTTCWPAGRGINRLARVRGYLDAALAEVFAQFGLTAADFGVIVTLRRAGAPYRMPQARLMDALGLTSGTVSVRLDRLVRSGVVTRTPDPASARGSLVQLTGKGLDLFDQAAPVHLANEDRLLSALSDGERLALADLLRRLLASFEAHTSDVARGLGLTLEPAHIARQRRQAVGLAPAAGMLVAAVQPDSPAARAGIDRGDLLTHLDGQPTTSSTGLALLLADLAGRHSAMATIVRGNDESRVRVRLSGTRPERASPR